MGCFKAKDIRPPGMGGTTSGGGSLDPAGILEVGSSKKRQEEIFNKEGTYTDSRSCTTGGCRPDVVVEFRPSKSKYGEFGFDWLRIGDADVPIVESDKPYTENVGKHYYKAKDVTGTIIDVLCTDDNQINAGKAIFKIDTTQQQLLFSKFKILDKLTPMNVDDPATPEDERLPAFQRSFRYSIPVITLMPKDASTVPLANKKNHDDVNLEALLDVNVYIGKIKPKALKLGFASNLDKDIFNEAFTINKMNIPKKSQKGYIKITSKGTLTRDVTVYVYASTETSNNHLCGAFKVLRNDMVKDINLLYIGTKVNAELDSRNIPLDPKEKQPPIIDEKALRSKLGQALVNIKTITRETNLLDMTSIPEENNRLGWATAHVPNKKYDRNKHEKYLFDDLNQPTTTLNPNYDANIYEKKISNPKYDADNPSSQPRLIDNPNYKKPPLPTKAEEGLDFDNMLDKLELEYYNTHYLSEHQSRVQYYNMEHYRSTRNTVLGAFPTNTFRCYFLEDRAVSVHFKLVAGGGGTPGQPRSMFFGDSGTNIGVLAHEVGHNLGLKHTFTNDADIVYEFKTTDNIMDYNHKDMVFYYWQWKQMNEGIT